MIEDDSLEYFETYGELTVHRTMLVDNIRTDAYWRAIHNGTNNFKGKVVLDVGAGTGILSVFCAKAGAKKVYAVEACDSIIPILKEVIKDNDSQEVIEVVSGKIEDVNITEKVDIIVSEWMGHYLLHEGMLDSVISARNFMKSDAVMIPRKASMYIALCDMPDLARQWSVINGVNLCAVTSLYRAQAADDPLIVGIKDDDLMSEEVLYKSFDITSINVEDTKHITKKVMFVSKREGIVEGICIWWDVEMDDQITLSTSPGSPGTHWKQTVVLFPSPIQVSSATPICISVSVEKVSERRHEISLELLDASAEEHEIPCSCYYQKCQVAREYFYQTSNVVHQKEAK